MIKLPKKDPKVLEELARKSRERAERLRKLGFEKPTKEEREANLNWNLLVLQVDRLMGN